MRSTLTRRAVALAAAAGTLAALAGCSGGGDDAVSEPSAPSGPVDLRMTTWSSNEEQIAVFDEIADAYVAAHPDLVRSVTFEPVAGDDYTVGLTTQIAGGNIPDLAWIIESSAPEFVESGVLQDIAPVLESTEGYDLDDVLDSSLALWGRDDAIYAYPFSNSPFGVFVNTDLIAAAGQPNPADLVASGDWTWDKAREIAAAVAATPGDTGLIVRDFDFKQWEYLSTVWASFGAAPWSEDGSECTFDTPQMVDAMTWIHDAVFVDGAMPEPGTTVDFFAGSSAMTVTQISRASALDDSFAWDLVPLPDGPEGHVSVIGQAGIGVLAEGAHPDIAADFLAYFTDAENAAKLAGFFPSPREELLDASVLAASNPKLSEEQLQTVVIDEIPGAETKPSHANFAELKEQVRIALDDLWTPDADVDEVLGGICGTIEPLLER